VTLPFRSESVLKRDWKTIDSIDELVRVAVVGLGWFSREHAIPALKQSRFSTATVGVDPLETNRNRASDAFEIETLSPEEFHDGSMVDRYDALYVAAPNNVHLEYARTGHRFEKHVLCEKPMEKNVDRSRKMVTTFQGADSIFMIGYRMQFEPLVRRMREAIRDGLIGEPELIHSSVSQHLLDIEPDPDQWRLKKEQSGGGALINIGLYPLNTTRFILDEDPVSVMGATGSDHEAFADVDEKVAFQCRFPSGAMAMCTAQESAVRGSHLTVIGTEGRLHLEPAYAPWRTLSLEVEGGGVTTTVERSDVNQLTEQFDYFSQCVHTDEQPGPSGRVGLVDMEIVRAIYKSSESEQLVTL